MYRLLLHRLIALVPVLLVVTALTSLLVDLAPGDPAVVLAGERATPERVETIREQLELDRPVIVRFLGYLGGAVQGDLGRSLFSGAQVADRLRQTLPITASLGLLAMIWALAIAVPTGIAAAVYRDSWFDRCVVGAASLFVATPAFVLALVFVALFAITWRWFPVADYAPLRSGLFEWFRHLALPSLSLALPLAAELARQVRGAMVDTLEMDFIQAQRAKGLPPRMIIGKHALKNAAIPVVAVLGLQVGNLLGGAVIVEQVFGLPGFGSLALNAVTLHDFPMIQGVVLVSALVFVAVNFMVDLSYRYFNPRVRADGR